MFSFTPFYSQSNTTINSNLNSIPSTINEMIVEDSSWISEGYTGTQKLNYASSTSSSSSSNSISSDESEGILTPPTSPNVGPLDSKKKNSNKNVTNNNKTSNEDGGLSLDTLSLSSITPLSPPSSPLISSSTTSIPLPATNLKSKSPTTSSKSSSHNTSVPSPSHSSRAYEESHRGRSRWPRLLWNSDALDEPSLVVLKEYFKRAVGEELPILKMEMGFENGRDRGVGSRRVREWSEGMERGGL